MGTCASRTDGRGGKPGLHDAGSDLMLDTASGELVHVPRPSPALPSPGSLSDGGGSQRSAWRFGNSKSRVAPSSDAPDSPASSASGQGVTAALPPGFSVNGFAVSGGSSVGSRLSFVGLSHALGDTGEQSLGPRPRSSGAAPMQLVGTSCGGDESASTRSRNSVVSGGYVDAARESSLSGVEPEFPVIASLRRKSGSGAGVSGLGPPRAIGAARASSMRWSRGRPLGRGTQGSVYLAMSQADGMLMAVKEVPLPDRRDELETTVGRVRREVDLLMNLRHENIVRYLRTEVDDENLYIFTEWISGGSIADVIRRFGPLSSEETVRQYTSDMLHGLNYLHANGIIHRDIKGANVLVSDSGVVKLADFGCSRKLHKAPGDFDSACASFGKPVGTPYFMAPEALESGVVAPGIDVWALGCTVIEMMTGAPPWKERGFTSIIQLLDHIIGTTAPPMYPAGASADLVSFLDRCFTRDPARRPSASALLQHPFITGNGNGNAVLSPMVRGMGHHARAYRDHSRVSRSTSGGEDDDDEAGGLPAVHSSPALLSKAELLPADDGVQGVGVGNGADDAWPVDRRGSTKSSSRSWGSAHSFSSDESDVVPPLPARARTGSSASIVKRNPARPGAPHRGQQSLENSISVHL